MTELFIVLGVVVFSFALRSFSHRAVRKIGALGILAATFLVFYLPTDSIAAGVGGLAIWFLLPWVELLTRIRHLRLPLGKTLEKQAPPGRARFPALEEMTDEVESEGFEHVADTGWEWDGMHQFYRIFYDSARRVQTFICLTEQEGIGWAFYSLAARDRDGNTYRTTNVPFSSPMKMAPDVKLQQIPSAGSFSELLESHWQWLSGRGVESDQLVDASPDDLTGLLERETGRQIRHNLDVGLVRRAESDETVRYSWRGLFYLYFQLLKDMVKMC